MSERLDTAALSELMAAALRAAGTREDTAHCVARALAAPELAAWPVGGCAA